MRKLIKYSYNLIEYYKYYQDMTQPNVPLDVETQINNYIYQNYQDVKKQKYVSVFYDDYMCSLMLLIDPELEKEFHTHYPEKLF